MAKLLVLLSGYPCTRPAWGRSQNTGVPDGDDFSIFYKTVKYLKSLRKHYDVDFLCTTWDDKGKDKILDSYNPVLYDGNFSQSAFISQYSPLLDDYEKNRMRRREVHLESLNQNNDLVSSSIRCSSQLQSRINSINLARAHSLFTGGKYQFFLLTRYDIGFRGGFAVRYPSILTQRHIQWLSKDSKIRFILPSFDQLNCGFPDMWFYSNSSGLIAYAQILDVYINSLLDSSSPYQSLLTRGWPDSEYFEYPSASDLRQFSNICLKKTQVPRPPMVYPSYEAPNLHAFHKYFLSIYLHSDLLFMPFHRAVTSSFKSTNSFAITYMLLLSSLRLLRRVTVGLFQSTKGFL